MSVLTTWAQNACQTVFFPPEMCGCVCQGLVVLAQSHSDAIVCFHMCVLLCRLLQSRRAAGHASGLLYIAAR